MMRYMAMEREQIRASDVVIYVGGSIHTRHRLITSSMLPTVPSVAAGVLVLVLVRDIGLKAA
jgi:hypothetical protein